MPRKLIATLYLSLDGILEDPVGMEGSGLGNWTGPFSRGPTGDRYKHDELFAAGAVLLGRRTYDGFAAVWPQVKDETGFADRINGIAKYVVSTTLKTADWSNTTVISNDVAARVRALKSESGGDLLVYGSAALLHGLMPHGLVDAFNLMVFPTVLGRGKRLFADGWSATLKLRECAVLGSGIILQRYQLA